MSLFDIDYKAFIKQLLPGTMRKMVMWRWLLVLIAPLLYVYNQFKGNRATNLYYLQHTSQVVYMQAVLNDVFDVVARRITIADGVYYVPIYMGVDAEESPIYMCKDSEAVPNTGMYFSQYQQLYQPFNADYLPVYLPNNIMVTSGNYDFCVLVPKDVVFDAYYMNALINKYRLPGKGNYQIKTI